MARIQTETGVRNVQIDTVNGHEIRVATGYDAKSDKWPIHVYIGTGNGQYTKVQGQWLADSMNEAFDEGFRIGIAETCQQ